MKRLLIVEDEKMIRTGISVMVKRCNVKVEEVIECRNGVEALEILERCPIDVMFTDIKMPKMDGIELVDKISGIRHKPLVVVISGYDDFSYTVAMLQHGVKDYILKPIKREKVEEVLLKMEKELEKIHDVQDNQNMNFRNQLKYFLQTDIISEKEWTIAKRQFDEVFENEPWRIVIGSGEWQPNDESRLVIGNMEDKTVFFVTLPEAERWQQLYVSGEGLGVSPAYTDFRQYKCAFNEAWQARQYAFIKGLSFVSYEDMPKLLKDNTPWQQLLQQFYERFSTESTEAILKQYAKLFFDIRHMNVSPECFIEAITKLTKNMLSKYGHLVPDYMQQQAKLTPMYFFKSEDFMKIQSEWFEKTRCAIQEQFGENQNQNRIREAESYIRENYSKDINMAIVSNYVSMNYSLFSIMFKEYTGTNFVNYLKIIRIEAAKKLLVTTDKKIQDISREVGYENEKHFMKTFKNICGISPSDYRRNAEISRQLEN